LLGISAVSFASNGQAGEQGEMLTSSPEQPEITADGMTIGNTETEYAIDFFTEPQESYDAGAHPALPLRSRADP